MSEDEDLEERIERLEKSVELLAEAVEDAVDQGILGRQADELVENISTGASIKSEITRGTGTSDQDKHVIKGKGADADEALEEYREELDQLEDEFVDRIRDIQPVGGEEG